MNRYNSTEALVIRRQHRQETDLLITLLSPKLGKIVALAKNTKTIKSHRLGSLQLGNIVKVSLSCQKDIFWLTESITIQPFLQKSNTLIQYNLLFYFLEISNHLIAENQLIEGVYQILKKLIISLNHNHFPSMIFNEIEFINLLGFGLPSEIISLFEQKNYVDCQKQIKKHLETIIEKKIKSNELFK